MPVATALAVFFLIWWVVLFAVLPWGVSSQHEGNDIAPGTDPGAPSKARIGVPVPTTSGRTNGGALCSRCDRAPPPTPATTAGVWGNDRARSRDVTT